MFDDDAPVTSGPSSPMLDGALRPVGLDRPLVTEASDGDIRDSPSRLMHGATWRTINITATVYIANECCGRLPPYIRRITRGDALPP